MNNPVVELDFSKDFDFESKHYFSCYLNDELLIFTRYEKYEGPITLQYLPNGGIQSLFHGNLIIKVNNGFLNVKDLIYHEKEMTAKEFIDIKKDNELVNLILTINPQKPCKNRVFQGKN